MRNFEFANYYINTVQENIHNGTSQIYSGYKKNVKVKKRLDPAHINNIIETQNTIHKGLK